MKLWLFALVLALLVAALLVTIYPAYTSPPPATPPPPRPDPAAAAAAPLPPETTYSFSPWDVSVNPPALASESAPVMPSGATESRTGFLSALNGDALPGDTSRPRLLYTLTDARGMVTPLLIEGAAAAAYRGQWVTVEAAFGTPANGQFAFGVPVAQVVSVRPAAAPGAGSVTPGGGGPMVRPWVTILCRYSDVPDTPKPASWFEGAISSVYPGVNHYWQQISYNQANINGSIVVGWYNLPRPKSYYTQANGEIDWWRVRDDCSAAADPDVYFPDFYGVNFWMNAGIGCCAWGGYGWPLYLDGSSKIYGMTWIGPGGYDHQGIIAHEMGHGFDLPHSAASDGINAALWDVMSNAAADCRLVDPTYGCVGAGTITYQLNRAEWIPPERKYEVAVGTRATLNLERLNQPTGANAYLMARVPVRDSTTRYFTVEARYRVGYDGHLPGDAVIIYAVDTARDTPAWLVDADGVPPWDEGAMWRVGETFFDPASNISVRVVSANATGFTVTISNDAPYSVCEDVTEIPKSECEALEALYNSMGGSGWTNRTGWLQTELPCSWYGVHCWDGHVDSLGLNANNLRGTIPPQIGQLPRLNWLDLSYNGLTGGIPDTIGGLDELVVLILNDNDLDGSLPASMGSMDKLAWVGLWHNHLSGELPPELGSLPELTNLLLGVNRLSGPIPASFANLPKLEWLDLSYNQLSGETPAGLANMPTLTGINLRYNKLYFSDTALQNRLWLLDPLSLATQTTAPSTPYLVERWQNSIMLGWLLIDYTDHGGGYQVYSAAAPGGTFSYRGITSSKATGVYTVSGLQPTTTYYFKIRAYTPPHDLQQNALYSDFTPVFAATTHDSSAAVPTLHRYTTATPTLTWNPVTWAAYYDVQVARDAAFSSSLQTFSTAGLSLTLGPLDDGMYYWRVRAVGGGRTGGWSAAQAFVVDS
ncbi:MAG: hypothetical protein DWB42_14670 [Chloroflexi bacterium]|nr:hypothetical protein [Chloroflexota bacterium]MDL1885030.1 hypothetical protein [Anaerolineae bacterium CFX8]